MNKIKAKINIPFKNYASLIGYPFLEILKKLNIEPHLYKTIEKNYNDCSLSTQDKILSYPGVKKELLRLKKAGINIAVATSKNRERTQSILEKFFAEIDFDYIATPDDVKPGRGKPHPDQLLHCALATGIDPWNSIYIGDMEVDKEASLRAGFQFVHAGWGYGSIKDINDIWFASIKDFVDYLIS